MTEGVLTEWVLTGEFFDRLPVKHMDYQLGNDNLCVKEVHISDGIFKKHKKYQFGTFLKKIPLTYYV